MRNQVVADHNRGLHTVLIKLAGSLCLAEVRERDGDGTCPLCGAHTVSEYHGWMECDGCHDYAIEASQWRRIQRQREKGTW